MNMRLLETPVLRRRMRTTLASPRPRHAALAVSDQPVPRVPHNVTCPTCGAGVGVACKGHLTRSGTRYAHIERRVLAGAAARLAVYGPARPEAPRGTRWVHDSLKDDPLWRDR